MISTMPLCQLDMDVICAKTFTIVVRYLTNPRLGVENMFLGDMFVSVFHQYAECCAGLYRLDLETDRDEVHTHVCLVLTKVPRESTLWSCRFINPI